MKSTEWTLDIFENLFAENNENLNSLKEIIKSFTNEEKVEINFRKRNKGKYASYDSYFWDFEVGKYYDVNLEFRTDKNIVKLYIDTALNADTRWDYGTSSSGIFTFNNYREDFLDKFKKILIELNKVKKAWENIELISEILK